MKRVNRRDDIIAGHNPPVTCPRRSRPGGKARRTSTRDLSNQGNNLRSQPSPPAPPGVFIAKRTCELLRNFDEEVEQQFRWITEVVNETMNVLNM